MGKKKGKNKKKPQQQKKPAAIVQPSETKVDDDEENLTMQESPLILDSKQEPKTMSALEKYLNELEAAE